MNKSNHLLRLHPAIILALLISIVGPIFAQGVFAQPAANGITSPTADAVLSGTVVIEGVATDPQFRKWQLDLLRSGDPDQATFLALGEEPVAQATQLFEIDTRNYPDGDHMLRLRVVRQDTNYDEYSTPIVVDNSRPPSTVPAPVLLETSPANGAAWDGSPVVFSFDKNLAAGQLSISPQLDGETTVDGGTLTYMPATAPAPNTRYRFTVIAAQATDGSALISTPSISVQSTGPLAVSSTQPSDGAGDADPNNPIVVIFNRPVVPLTGIEAQADLPQPISIEPAVDGQGEWLSTSVYSFLPDRPLGGAVTYRVTVEPLTSVNGDEMTEPYTFQFTTAAPIVLSADPQGLFVAPDSAVSVSFSLPMDQASTEAAFSLTEQTASTPVAGNISWNITDTILTFTPTVALDFGGKFAIQVDDTALAASQEGAIAAAYSSDFTVVPLPAVLTTSILDGAAGVNPETDLRVRFSAPVSETTVMENIRIEGILTTTQVISYTYSDYYENSNQGADTIQQSWPQGYDTHLMLNWYREPNKTYTVTIGGSIADIYGNTIGEDTALSFTTGDYPPLIQIDLDRFTHYSAATPPVVGIKYRNQETIKADLLRLPLPSLYVLGGENQWSVWDSYEVPDRNENLLWSKTLATTGEANVINVEGIKLTDADGNALPPGVYLLEVLDPTTTSSTDGKPTTERAVIVLTNRNLLLKRSSEGDSLAWVTDLLTGQPVAEAPVQFLIDGKSLATAESDGDGMALANLQLTADDLYTPVFAISGEPGDADFAVVSSDWGQGIEPWNFNLRSGGALDQAIITLYTERPIYRPGQTVYFKGIVRVLEEDQWALPPPGTPVDVRATDGFGRVILIEQHTTNAFGTFDGAFATAPDASTGYYSIVAQVQAANAPDIYGSANFQVAAYRKPEFQIETITDKPEYIQGDTIKVTVRANYYSGGPLVNAPVEWQLTGFPYSFTWKDAPSGRYYSFDPYDPDQINYNPYSGNSIGLLTQGKGVTDEQGVMTIELPADLGDSLSSQTWSLNVTITSPTNQQVYGNVSFPVHRGAYYIGLSPTSYVAQAGQETTIDVVTVAPDGSLFPDATLEVIAYEFQWNSVYEQAEDGNYYWKSTADRTPVFTTTATTDGSGTASIRFTPEQGGQYQITASGTDGSGNQISSATYIWVSAAADQYVAWPRENNDRMELVADKKLYAPDDTARILVPNPYTGPVQALVTIERSGVIDARVVELNGSSETLEVPITGAYIPNIYVGVVIVKGVDESNPYPTTRHGYVMLPVDTSEKALAVEIEPSSMTFRPGDTVTYTVTIRDSQGNPVPAVETSFALVDKAVLDLAGDAGVTSSLLDIFYYERPLGVNTGSLIVINKDRVSQQLTEGGKGGGGGGGDGGLDVRQDFPDTAYWRADLVSDENGVIQFSVKLPDSLTTWRLSAKGVSAETLVGEATKDIITTKELQVRPALPRFFTAGDRAIIGGVVVNAGGEPMTDGAFTIEVSGATLETEQTTGTFDLAPNESVRFDFPLAVDADAETVVVTMTATAGAYDDGVRIDLPVLRYATPEVVGTSGVVPVEGVTEAIYVPAQATDDGELQVTLDASLAAGMIDGLTYLEHYPYECNEQTVSRFLPNLFTVGALRDLAIDDPELETSLSYQLGIGVQRLVGRQNPDGGWGYWAQQESTPFITAYVLWGLASANEMGYAVDQTILDQAASYLETQFMAPDQAQPWELNQMAFMHYVLSAIDRGDAGRMSTLYDVRARLASYGEALLAMAMHNVDATDSRVGTLVGDLVGSAELTATGASWHDAIVDYQIMSTDTRSTAIVLAALTQLDPQQPILPNVVRWLMSAREAGRWSSTQETAWSIIGLTDWMVATGELAADYDWAVTLNDLELGSGHFGAENITTQETLRVAVADLLRDQANLLRFSRSDNPGQLYYTTQLQYYLDALAIEPLDRGIVIDRRFRQGDEQVTTVQSGDIVSVTVTIVAPTDLYHLLVEAPIPAGLEPLDPNLPGGNPYDQNGQPALKSVNASQGGWYSWTPSYLDFQDEKVALFATYLPAGTYEYTFATRAATAGEFRVLPAHGEMMYFPEVWGRSGGALFTVTR